MSAHDFRFTRDPGGRRWASCSGCDWLHDAVDKGAAREAHREHHAAVVTTGGRLRTCTWARVLHHCDVRACDLLATARSASTAAGSRMPHHVSWLLHRGYVPRFTARSQSGGWRSNARELAAEFGITPQYVGQLANQRWRTQG